MKELQTTCLIYYKKVLHPDVEGRKDMFYLTTHSTHFIYNYMASDMVKDQSDSEKINQRERERERERERDLKEDIHFYCLKAKFMNMLGPYLD